MRIIIPSKENIQITGLVKMMEVYKEYKNCVLQVFANGQWLKVIPDVVYRELQKR